MKKAPLLFMGEGLGVRVYERGRPRIESPFGDLQPTRFARLSPRLCAGMFAQRDRCVLATEADETRGFTGAPTLSGANHGGHPASASIGESCG